MELSFTARNVLLGSTMLGAIGGVLGGFTLLRRQSLVGDALAHAALPGVCLAFLVTGTKTPGPLLAGALAAGLLGAAATLGIVRGSRVKEDTAIGVVLSVFFGFGIVLLTYVQKLPLGSQGGLDHYLFGQAATLVPRDLAIMAVLGSAVLLAIVLFYKELKIVSFDPAYARSLGLPVRSTEALLTVLLAIVVVLGLQTVGVVLMVATLVNPPAAARQWTDRLGTMLGISALVGAGSGAAGALASSSVSRLPTGPVIVLVSSAVLVVSILVAPRRGILWAAARERLVARKIRRENLLKDLWGAGESHGDWVTGAPSEPLARARGQSARELRGIARSLLADGLIERAGEGLRLTTEGRDEAERIVRKHRLWELYLARRLDLPSDHVHRDAEAMEHALPDDALALLEERLGHPTEDPHGKPIPPARRG